jgi:hypothetical protein
MQPTAPPPTPPRGAPTPPGTTPDRKVVPVSSRPEFRIEWRDVLRVSPTTTTGMTEEEAEKAATAARPLIVYIYGSDRREGKDPRYAIEDERVFRDDKVLVGARFFDCVRIHELDAKKDKALRKHAHKAPCLVFLRPDYDAVKCLRPKWTRRRLYGAMFVTLRKDYENCIHCVFAAQKTMAAEEGALADARRELGALQGKVAAESNPQRLVSLKKKAGALERRVKQAEAELEERRAKLYELRPKTS